MNVLAVDDDALFLEALADTLRRIGHDVTTAQDSNAAWEIFKEQPFDVVVCDWTMPGTPGPDLCQMIRALCREQYCYILMLTASSGADRAIAALDAGADDFMTKPFDSAVLAARLRVADRIRRLHAHVTRLEGLLSVCSYCKQIRRDDGTWQPIEIYLMDRSDLKFSHGVCDMCLARYHSQRGA